MYPYAGGGGEFFNSSSEASPVEDVLSLRAGGQAGFIKGCMALGYDNSARSALKELATNDFLLTTKRTAFTMAEILLSLTIIGVVVAITLPSLTGNINERTWNTQRKALYSRISQAIALMPSLNGYGTYDATTDNAAETFLTNGLAKVYKINNICDADHITDCGFKTQYIDMAGSKKDFPKTLRELNPLFVPGKMNGVSVNTKVAAFETQSGESILAYYNPRCTSDHNTLISGFWQKTAPFMCVNFIYDLNGSKGPNSVTKDIGAITVLYASDAKVVAPIPLPTDISEGTDWNNAIGLCRAANPDTRMPNLDELTGLYYNENLYNIVRAQNLNYWSSTAYSATQAWDLDTEDTGRDIRPKAMLNRVRCIWR